MYYDAVALGSCVLKINQDTLSVIFLRQSGAIDDEFTLIKDLDCVPGNTCNDNDACTINDVFDNNCYCRGIPDFRFVSTTNDAGNGTLRDAITTACEGDTILFLASVNDTIELNTQIVIDKNVVITADPSDEIIISGQQITRIFKILPGVELTLSGLILHGGNNPVEGGAILNDGLLILDNTEFINNTQGVAPRAWTNNNEIRLRQGSSYIRLN